jgi:hypothetical protein
MAPTRSSFYGYVGERERSSGYRLDVSTDPSFKSFVSGYENLDVAIQRAAL